ERLEPAILLTVADHRGRFAAQQAAGRFEIDLRRGVEVERLQRLAEEVRRQIVEDDRELLRGNPGAALLHAVDHGRPALARQPDRRRSTRLVTRRTGLNGDLLARAV